MKIKVYDFKTKKITEMPQEELAPGYVKARIQGMQGEYFVNAADAKTISGYRHPAFGNEEKKIMKYLEGVFSEVNPMTAQEWEDGFRKDTNMDREILLWLQMAEIYQHYTVGKDLTLEAKKDYLTIILTVSGSGLDFPRSLIDLQWLSRPAMEEVVNFIRTSRPTAKYFEKYMGKMKTSRLLTPQEIKIYDKVYNGADVIFSKDRKSILKGKEKLEEISRTGVPQALNVITTDAEVYRAWEQACGSGN